MARSLALIGLFFTLRRRQPPVMPDGDAALPSVVVQLPVYREERVLDRLLGAVLALDYPAERLAVQVIDDSEQPLAARSEAIVRRYQGGRVSVEYLWRDSRVGYKAGALNHGHRKANGDLIAVFDADFLPRHDFLRKTVPYFQEETVGAVQARWSYMNDFHSPLTMLQAAVFDTLFSFENGVRQAMCEPGIFLGTNGVWRKRSIDDIGGWQETPFTSEDIDITYRAHRAGWFIAFRDETLATSELPDTYLVYRGQQRRWARGTFRAFLDHWRQAFGAQRTLRMKALELSLILMQFTPPLLVLLALLSGLYVGLGLPRSGLWLAAQIALSASLLCSPTMLELILSQKLAYRDWPQRWLMLVRALPLAIGLSVSLIAGFWDTLTRSEAEFLKTAKQGDISVIRASQQRWLRSAIRITSSEIILGLIILVFLALSVARSYPEAWLPLGILASGYLTAGLVSAREIRQKLRSAGTS